MKKGLILGLAISSVGAGAFIYSLPYLTVSNIIKGIVENDSELLDDNIDFPGLQSNLKNNVQKAIDENLSKQASSNDPWEAFGQQFTQELFSSIANNIIEENVTPTALGSIPIESKKRGFLYYFSDTKSGYQSFNKFRVSKQSEFAKTTLILSRRGLHWELTNVTISNVNTDAITKEIQNSWQEKFAQYLPENNNQASAPISPKPAPSPTPALQYSSEPQASLGNQSRSSPVDFVASHYADLNNRDYSGTWSRLSSNFSSSLSYDDYTNWWDSVSEIQLNDITVISQESNTARVKADLTYVMNDGRSVQDKKPFINLIWDSNSENWLIDQKSD